MKDNDLITRREVELVLLEKGQRSRRYKLGDVWELNFDEIREALSEYQPKIVRCKDCKHWIPGYITEQDDFIPPKCGKYQQMVGHSADDYCSLAEKQEGR